MPLQHAGAMTTSKHRHRWVDTSVHRVSDGLVIYQRCLCGRWRVLTPAYAEEAAQVG